MTSKSFLPSPFIPTNPKHISLNHSSAVAGPRRRFPRSARAIASPDTPWLFPSLPLRKPSHSCPDFALHRINSSAIGHMPISLRLVQMKKKTLDLRRRQDDPSSLGSTGAAIWSLICLLEELHKSAISVAEEADRDKFFWHSTEPLVWLFLRVFSASPNLLAGVLTLTADFVAVSVDRCVVETASSALNSDIVAAETALDVVRQQIPAASSGGIVGSSEIGDFMCWADIGILEDSLSDQENRRPVHRRRRLLYESIIVRQRQPNSLFLSNYAQFLYQCERDLTRAHEYFKLAVTAVQPDGEAMSRYAKFLWHERGDVAGAEEMFLGAIEADPTSSYHQSCYAYFLMLTSGDETYFPLDKGSFAEDGNCGVCDVA